MRGVSAEYVSHAFEFGVDARSLNAPYSHQEKYGKLASDY
jgi:hypothetical protein